VVEAVSICEETPGPVASIVRAAILHHDEDKESIQRAIEETGLEEISATRAQPGHARDARPTHAHDGPSRAVLGMMRVLLTFQENRRSSTPAT